MDSQRSCPKSATPTRSRKGETRPAGTKRQLHGTMRADGASPLGQVLVEGERIGAHELGVRRDLALVTVRRANEDPLGHAIGVDQRLDGSRRPAGSRFSARKGEPAANLSSGRV